MAHKCALKCYSSSARCFSSSHGYKYKCWTSHLKGIRFIHWLFVLNELYYDIAKLYSQKERHCWSKINYYNNFIVIEDNSAIHLKPKLSSPHQDLISLKNSEIFVKWSRKKPDFGLRIAKKTRNFYQRITKKYGIYIRGLR